MATVIFPETHYQKLHEHLADAYPNEGAGFLLGTIAEGRFVVEDVYVLPNSWDEGSQRNRFRLDPQDALKAELAADKRDLDVIGVFHSHPDHPAQPSQWDLEWATWPNFAYLIATVTETDGVTRTRAWQLTEDRSGFTEDEVEIVTAETP